jgi:SAM-dependent methyltransferase
VPLDRYERVPYPTYPRGQTHPDCLASVATLFGIEAAPVARCRVLELGCGNGGNLLPMAYALPETQFTGIDLAQEAIEEAGRMMGALRLANVRLIAGDLVEIGPGFGEFDYIIAHGLYSWVPQAMRDHLLSICRECLASNGVAFISYNCYPGGHVRQMFRGMMRYHVRGIEDPHRAIAEARRFLRVFLETRMLGPEWQALLDREANIILERDDAGIYHDDLAPVNDPVWFHEFAAHAARFGLQYLGEAEPYEMFDHRGVLASLDGNLLDREQHLDFLKARRFRQTLLCRDSVTLDRNAGPDKMDLFHFSASGRKMGIATEDGPARQVAQALQDVFPLPASFGDLLPYAGNAESLREILFSLVMAGFADLHVHDFPCADSVSERPRASAVARYQAERSSSVTNLCHLVVELDDTARQVIRLLDGTRTAEEIGPAREWLEWMAETALLEG